MIGFRVGHEAVLLSREIRTEVTIAEQLRYHDATDPHMRARWLSDVVLGAQDGIVNTLGVLLGVASATSDARIVLATGMAAAVAESISMAAVAYTSSVARGEQYRAERDREFRHLDAAPTWSAKKSASSSWRRASRESCSTGQCRRSAQIATSGSR